MGMFDGLFGDGSKITTAKGKDGCDVKVTQVSPEKNGIKTSTEICANDGAVESVTVTTTRTDGSTIDNLRKGVTGTGRDAPTVGPKVFSNTPAKGQVELTAELITDLIGGEANKELRAQLTKSGVTHHKEAGGGVAGTDQYTHLHELGKKTNSQSAAR